MKIKDKILEISQSEEENLKPQKQTNNQTTTTKKQKYCSHLKDIKHSNIYSTCCASTNDPKTIEKDDPIINPDPKVAANLEQDKCKDSHI